MSARPWYAWYPGDAALKTAHLSLAEFGAYRRLLDHYYGTGRPLPNDMLRLCRIAGTDHNQITVVTSILDEFFTLEKDGLFHNKRADNELLKQLTYSEKQSLKGKASAQARWGNRDNRGGNQTITYHNHNHNPQLQPQSTTTPTRESAPPRKTARAQKLPLPPDFAPSARVLAWAAGKGFSQIPQHCEAFRLKCQANGYAYADWDSAFMEAIRKDWAGLRSNGHDPTSLADLLQKEGNS